MLIYTDLLIKNDQFSGKNNNISICFAQVKVGIIVNRKYKFLNEGYPVIRENDVISVYLYCIVKELSLCHKLCFSKSYIFGFQCRRPLIFQTMNSVRSNNISLKYQRFTTLDLKDIVIIKSEFVAKSQFL